MEESFNNFNNYKFNRQSTSRCWGDTPLAYCKNIFFVSLVFV